MSKHPNALNVMIVLVSRMPGEVGAVEADEEVPRSFGVGHSGIPQPRVGSCQKCRGYTSGCSWPLHGFVMLGSGIIDAQVRSMKTNCNRGIPCPTYKFTARDETFPAPAQQIPCPPVQGICRKPLKRQRQSALASPNLCTIRKNSLPSSLPAGI